MTIKQPGIYPDISEDIYHADPCVEPSLSSSIAKVMIDTKKTARHAWMSHPRLNPNHKPLQKKNMDFGSVVHKLVLNAGPEICVIDSDAFRTKDAKTERDAAYEAGETPILIADYERAQDMAMAASAQLQNHEDARNAFDDCKTEQTIIWQENGVWCRCRLDVLPNSGNIVFDYKTTTGSASADDWGKRSLFDLGGEIQTSFYRRGLRAVMDGKDYHFRFIVQETEPPYALNVIALSPMAIGMADRKVDEAIRRWSWCLKNDRWPGFPNQTCYVDPPVWHQMSWEAEEQRDELAKDAGQDLKEMMIEWQSPLEDENDG